MRISLEVAYEAASSGLTEPGYSQVNSHLPLAWS